MRRKSTGRTGRGKEAAALRAKPTLAAVPRAPVAEDAIRLVIATQPALLCDVLSRLLSHEEHFEVVGQAHDENQILEVARDVTPDLLLFDYEALGPNSESIISRLRRLAPQMRILVVATRSADADIERVLRAGAAGVVGKQFDFETLLRAIRAVASGELWANRRTQARTLEQLTSLSAGAAQHEGHLTRREQQIVESVARGLRNKEIARQLNISEKTVKSHLNNIFQKLRLEGRFALAVFEGQVQPKA